VLDRRLLIAAKTITKTLSTIFATALQRREEKPATVAVVDRE